MSVDERLYSDTDQWHRQNRDRRGWKRAEAPSAPGIMRWERNMAYVITAVGAGGKTTWLRKRGQEYLRRGKRTALTTTTHIWPDRTEEMQRCRFPEKDAIAGAPFSQDGREQSALSDDMARAGFTAGTPDCYGIREDSGKLSWPGDEEYTRICERYDVVLVEGDGSHCMPMKIPGLHEPVIPENTDEIAVIMGAHAIGRRVDVVCQRYGEKAAERDAAPSYAGEAAAGELYAGGAAAGEPYGGDAIVTERMLEETARRYYMEPLAKRFPGSKITYVLSRMPEENIRIAGVVMASGFGRRYGGNKLVDLYAEKPLYRHTLEHVCGALGKENTVVVTQYDQIINEVRKEGVAALMNGRAGEGIAASIRLGTKWALDLGADAVIFFAADMPNLPEEEIRRYAGQFAGSGKAYGCMEFGKEHTCTNPGSFRLKESAEKLLQLDGDRGAMRIMKQEPWNTYYYQIPAEYAEDIDVR